MKQEEFLVLVRAKLALRRVHRRASKSLPAAAVIPLFPEKNVPRLEQDFRVALLACPTQEVDLLSLNRLYQGLLRGLLLWKRHVNP